MVPMPQVRYITIERRPRNVFVQLLAFVFGLGILAVAVVLGAFLLAALLGAGLIAAAVFYLRLWWVRRRMARTGEGDSVLETEYTVVRTERDDPPP